MPPAVVTPNCVRALGLVMRVVLLAVLFVVTTACGAYVFPGGGPSPSPSTGQVSGRVLAVPCAPVENVNSPCAGRPVGGLELDYVAGGKVVGRTVTDGDGNYSIRLEPGTYAVAFKTYMRVISGPTKIAVAAGANITADYLVDSGIRVPAA